MNQQQQQMQQHVNAQMAQLGYQLFQGTDGQWYFHNAATQQVIPYQTAYTQVVNNMAVANRQQYHQPVGIPTPGFVNPNGGMQGPPVINDGRYSSVSPGAYPPGSVQAANQRSPYPTESASRFGAPMTAPIQQQPVQSQPPAQQRPTQPQPVPVKEAPVNTPPKVYPSSIFSQTKTSSQLAVLTKAVVAKAFARHTASEQTAKVGHSVRELFELLVADPEHNLISCGESVLVEHCLVPDPQSLEKLAEISHMHDARALYKLMERLAKSANPYVKAVLLAVDRVMTTAVNDFLLIFSADPEDPLWIDSFFDDFRALNKKLRDTTDSLEDDLLDHLKEILVSRAGLFPAIPGRYTLADPFVMLRLDILPEEMGLNAAGVPDAAFTEKMNMICEKVVGSIFYMQLLDNSIYKVYNRSTAAGSGFLIKAHAE